LQDAAPLTAGTIFISESASQSSYNSSFIPQLSKSATHPQILRMDATDAVDAAVYIFIFSFDGV
jgi:hypothetical protein